MQTGGDTTHEEGPHPFVPISEPLEPGDMLEALKSIGGRGEEGKEESRRPRKAPESAQGERAKKLASFREERKTRATRTGEAETAMEAVPYMQWIKRLGLLLAAGMAGAGFWYLVSGIFLDSKQTGSSRGLAQTPSDSLVVE